jgi:hypothetical protein
VRHFLCVGIDAQQHHRGIQLPLVQDSAKKTLLHSIRSTNSTFFLAVVDRFGIPIRVPRTKDEWEKLRVGACSSGSEIPPQSHGVPIHRALRIAIDLASGSSRSSGGY